ncbi:MAG: valine--tRNA ligase [Bacteriovoracaceae bacterium]|nr:valine--tRNA ligase [Bacteriovoracaceae bacterium]
MSIPEKYNPKELEAKWMKHWREQNTYAWDKSKSRTESFIVDTPPPTVSGSLHLGHIFSYTHTDLLVRYQRMLGKNIFYPMGWDDNGLPTERRVQNIFGVQCDLQKNYEKNFQGNRDKKKDDPTDLISRENFIELCAQVTGEDEKVFEHLFERVGLSVDFSLQYATIDEHSRKISQASFLDLVKKGEAYSVEAPVAWDIDFSTAVAQAEVEDREVSGNYYDLKFSVEGGEEFIISTTRPELLPACIAIVAHPDDERFKKYFGKFAVTPLFSARVPILPAEHADPEKGTGILMVCTFGDSHDVAWWKTSKLPARPIMNKKGFLLPLTFGEGAFTSLNPQAANGFYKQIEGTFLKKAQKIIVDLLKQNNFLQGEPKPTQRSVKFYEKGDKPLEYLTSRQWFVRIMKHKEALLEQGKKITWHPEHMRTRYEHWVQGLNQDWCISRQRYFGVPFPVWYKVGANGAINYDEPLYADINSLPVDPTRHAPCGYSEEQRGKPNGFVPDLDVMDTWATSSLTPQISSHWNLNSDRHAKTFPADLRPQSHEIIRTWAFYTILKSYLHTGDIPWKHIAISGWILDPDRKKMSKSKGNVVTPENYLDQYGADAVRYWAARARLGTDTAFDEKVFQMGWKLSNKLFNASKFVLGITGSDRSVGIPTVDLDKSWLAVLNQALQEATKSFEAFDYAGALQNMESVFWDFCDNYVELIKGRAYQGNDVEKKSAIVTLNLSLNIFLKSFAPFFPYLTEEIYSWLGNTHSIHKEKWPTLQSEGNSSSYELACTFIGLVREARTKAQKGQKVAIQEIEMEATAEFQLAFQKLSSDLMACGNITNAVKWITGTDAVKVLSVQFSD